MQQRLKTEIHNYAICSRLRGNDKLMRELQSDEGMTSSGGDVIFDNTLPMKSFMNKKHVQNTT